MIKFFILLLLVKSTLFGCSLCSIYSPKTHVSSKIEANKTHIKSAKINWTFAKEFTKELLTVYDTNLNGTFDKKELEVIEDALLAYIVPKNYLTFISYGKQISELSNKIIIKHSKFSFENGVLKLDYTLDLNYKIKDGHRLYLEIYDSAGYFLIVFNEKSQLFSIPYQINKEVAYNGVTYVIKAPSLNKTGEKVDYLTPSMKEEKQSEDKNLIEKSLEEQKKEKEPTLLEDFVKKIKQNLIKIEEGNDKFALIFLLFASFIYGVVHAMGPGHGKALAFSYFSAQKSSYIQAFFISLATAFIHIVGALILVVVSIFILQSVLNSFLDDSITYITQVSAVLIMLLSIFILYRKLKKKSCACSACNSNITQPLFSTKAKEDFNFVKNSKNSKIHFDKRSRKKQDLIFVLIAGIIPCPGTVVLFVYAFILKTYFSVILASIAISLGMGLVIFASSFLGVSLNKVSSKSTRLVNIVEILAPIFMFILGLLLLLNADLL
ncbi:MAG: DUF1007 family protein [Campylobacterota bacterium]